VPTGNANGRKGAATERMVAKYFREQGFWMADRRLREGRNDDQGDIDGVPFTTVQVKYVESNRYQKWVEDTLKQRDTAGTPLCLLVRRTPHKPVEQWEASVPSAFFLADFEYPDGGSVHRDALDEQEAWTWVRMDLRLAVVVVKRLTAALANLQTAERELVHDRYSLDPYSATTSRTSISPLPVTTESSSAPSTEKGTPASPTT